MKERLLKLEELIEKFKEDSLDEKHKLADFMENSNSNHIDKLCEEIELYNKIKKDINNILNK